MPPALQPPPAGNGEEPVTVLVTGFGPFLSKFPKNTSWEIASRLPALIPSNATNPNPIHIHVHHEPIRVAYNTVTSLIPKLLPPANPMHPTPSIILHIGLAAGRDYYTLEKGSFSRGYGAIPDVDGKKFSEEAAEELFPRSLYPNTLQTSFDTADVLVRWKQNLSSPTASFPDVRNSPDGGNFMCGFIYWNSLAHYYSINEHGERPVVFLHVPDLSESPEQIEVGVGVAVALIKALVESRRKVGFVDGWVNVGKGSEGEEDARAATDNNFV